MDYPIANAKRTKVTIFQEFHYLDLIPYSIAVLMLSGSIYMLTVVIELTKHVK